MKQCLLHRRSMEEGKKSWMWGNFVTTHLSIKSPWLFCVWGVLNTQSHTVEREATRKLSLTSVFACVLILFIIITKRLRLLLNGGICWWSKWAGEQSGWTSAIHIQLTTSYVCHNCHSYKSYYKTDTIFSTPASLSLLFSHYFACCHFLLARLTRTVCVYLSVIYQQPCCVWELCFGATLSSCLLTNALLKIH